MARDLGEFAVEGSVQERTYLTVIETPLGEMPVVIGKREVIRRAGDGTRVGRDEAAPVRRELSQITDKVYAQGDKTLTGAELAAFIALALDQAAAEDAIAASAVAEEMAAAAAASAAASAAMAAAAPVLPADPA